jgi:F-type H+-transporting ATPase subunit a
MRIVVLLYFLVMCSLSTVAYGAISISPASEKQFDATEMIMHHIADAHEFHIVSYRNAMGEMMHITLPLPIILWHDSKLHVFMSSRFQHGIATVPLGSDYTKLYHGKIYLTDSEGSIVYNDKMEVMNKKPLSFSITKNVASMFLGSFVVLLLFIPVANRYNRKGALAVPKGAQLLVEPIILYIRDDIARSQIDPKKADFFVPYLLSLFFFIWINNLIGLIPFFPGGANLSGNIAFTMTLAVVSFFMINVYGSKHYWKEVLIAPGMPFYVKLFLVPIEIIGLFTKPFALMLRLFANITAGHIIILSLTSIVFVIQSIYVAPLTVLLSLIMYSLEFLVALLQAYVFTLLTALFIGMAVNEHH